MRERGAIICLAVGQTLIWATIFYVFPALMVLWEAEFGWGRTDIALGFTLALITSACAAPLVGRAVDAGHGRALMTGGALAGAILLASLTVIAGWTAFLAIWALIGIAQAACLYEPCFALVTRAKGRDARAPITTITLAAGFASTLAYLTAAPLAAAWGWRGAALVFAAVAGLVAAPLFWAAAGALTRMTPEREDAPAPAAAAAAGGRRRFGRPGQIALAAAFALMSFNHGVAITHLLPLLDERGLALGTAALVASAVGPSQVAGRIALALLGARAPAATATGAAFAALALAAAVLIAAGGDLAALGLFAVLQGGAAGALTILRPAVILRILGGRDFGRTAGMIAAPALFAYAAAPLAGAALWEIGGYDLVFAITAGAAVAALLCLHAAMRAAPPEDAAL